MSQQGHEANPVRRRAGLISALVKLYVNVKSLIEDDASAEEALQLHEKIHERYTIYLECHETALETYPDREQSLTEFHVRNELRHQKLLKDLEAYIKDGTKPDNDTESLHAASIFSQRSASFKSTSVKYVLKLENQTRKKLHTILLMKARANISHHKAITETPCSKSSRTTAQAACE